MTFFMFSYHVHEKSILLPLLIAPFLTEYVGPTFIFNLVLSGTIGKFEFKLRHVSFVKIGRSMAAVFRPHDILRYFYGELL